MCLAEMTQHVHAGGRNGQEEQPHTHEATGSLSRRRLLVTGGVAALAAATGSRPAFGARVPAHGIQDLTYVLSEDIPVFADPMRPRRRTAQTIERDGLYGQQWSLHEHVGTHIDAPAHFAKGGRVLPQLRAEELLADVVVIDISARAARNADAVVTADDLLRFERRYGRIPRNAAVFMYSGWGSRVGSEERYRNRGPDGRYHFPGFGAEAVQWLLANRRIKGIGVDTLSLDAGRVTDFPVHHRLLGADRWGLENLAFLQRIPPRGATVWVGAVPFQQGSGGPCRVIARW